MDEISCSMSMKKFHTTEIYDAAEKYLFGLSPPGNVRSLKPFLEDIAPRCCLTRLR